MPWHGHSDDVVEYLRHGSCESCCRKDSALQSTKTAHSVMNTQAKAMSRTWEKMEGSVDHIMQAREWQPHESLHSLEMKNNTTRKERNFAEQMHTLHCRGHADWDIGPKKKQR